ncbi:hypothetical protein BR93DRAFT_936855 [Coniochaeta sp. PMI_546]|nr:hypothetical protein BR93DRAFT_936855 [Coniochaeta sp. PMI_546]
MSTLQQLFAEKGIRTGSKPIYSVSYDPKHHPQGHQAPPRADSEVPRTTELLERAVAGKRVDVVKFILQTDPALSLSQAQGVVNAVLDNPDPVVLRALIDHEPGFVDYSVDYGMRTILSDVCFRRSTDIVPVVHVLLDNGATSTTGIVYSAA